MRSRRTRIVVVAVVSGLNEQTGLQGIEIRPQAKGRPLFTRPFDAELDALYVTRDKWEEFCLEPIDRLLEPDLHGQSVDLKSDLVKIAVPEALFLDSETISWLPELEMWLEHLRVLLVVIGPQPDADDVSGPWRWEVEEVEGASFTWCRDKQDFELYGGKNEISGENALYKRLREAANQGLREELLRRRLEYLEIQPIFAARR